MSRIPCLHSPISHPATSLEETDDDMVDWPLSEDDDIISNGSYCLIFAKGAGNFNVILVVSLF